ncbi:ABC transporter permease [Sulfolobus sp. A20]|uniref:ABC transporter permease n=1 Tax=Sulfolobaceae TaxID=118883 RepID=UPI000845E642|nr:MULTISPECIES: ABC transporter permease [unclassified Sulfolobus]TRM75584.1 ABC transporter permease [Sulfolobus sp. B5]TRM86745.1 ABC transporter permease [Sulfolobus sp. C3]TRN04079.1 ABC transporter permease [Sulfolobus sp. F1]AOL16519.1 ABC transporter permease [Sulfolobus sp. A20]TRM97353.1 ABC transporter permease [Sulfolobus sp. B1]
MRKDYIIKRGIYYVIIWFIGISLDFILPRLIPGNVLGTIIYGRIGGNLSAYGQNVQQEIETLVQQLGLSQYYHTPLYIQYFDFLKDIIRLNFGPSLTEFPISVGKIIAEAAPWTFMIVIPAVVAAFFIGNLLGRSAALHRGGIRDYVILGGTMFLYTFPVFVTGEILIEFLAVDLHIFPTGGQYNTFIFLKPTFSLPFIWSVIYHAILPVLTLVLFSLAGWIIGMRNNMIPILQEDYMNYYRLMGVPERVISSKAYRLALLPNFTSFSIALGYSVLGAVAIEYLFNYAGLGYFFNQAITGLDYPLLNGIFFMLVTAMVLSNFVADIIYGIIDPRTSKEETEGE